MRANHAHPKYNNQPSLRDDLPVCKSTGIGFSTNQIYREDSNPQEDHPYEDCSSHFNVNNQLFLYSIFDGFEGKGAANFCSDQMTAELIFGNFSEWQTDEKIKNILRQACENVEKNYMVSLGNLLAQRTNILCEIPPGSNIYEFYKKCPSTIDHLNQINYELSSGAAAAVALIYKSKLYVANIGNCRVLLCKNDPAGVLSVLQLSDDHDLHNEDELLRLSQLGVKTNCIKDSLLGTQGNTRCLGNYLVKGAYKEFEGLNTATSEPIIAEPDVHGGIPLDESCRFLLLMSAGMTKSVAEVTGSKQVNLFIAEHIVKQFREQATLTGVAQAVVDEVVRLHRNRNCYSSSTSASRKREDITLMLRNFNYPLPNAISPTFTPVSVTASGNTILNSIISNSTSSTLENTGEPAPILDERIDAYVDFTEFTRNFERALHNGQIPQGIDF